MNNHFLKRVTENKIPVKNLNINKFEYLTRKVSPKEALIHCLTNTLPIESNAYFPNLILI